MNEHQLDHAHELAKEKRQEVGRNQQAAATIDTTKMKKRKSFPMKSFCL
ncbi:hypothetical protein [Paenisporosarcina indica]|nr:hypothetical protein [Paenisporosarcina indica]